MINSKWFELPVSRTNILGPKDVRAHKILLYLIITVAAQSLGLKSLNIKFEIITCVKQTLWTLSDYCFITTIIIIITIIVVVSGLLYEYLYSNMPVFIYIICHC